MLLEIARISTTMFPRVPNRCPMITLISHVNVSGINREQKSGPLLLIVTSREVLPIRNFRQLAASFVDRLRMRTFLRLQSICIKESTAKLKAP